MPAYNDLDRPPLSATALSRALIRPGSLWTEVRVVGETGSTNADLAAAAAAGAGEGLVLVGESQSGGRGRLDRVWVSPPQAGLTFSVLLRPTIPKEQWGWLPLLAGVAVARVIEQVAQVEARVKWPNDVLVGPERRKVAGVLAEVSGEAVVLGIGVNVTTRRVELPVPEATSLVLEGAESTDRMPLLVAVLRSLAEDYAVWLAAAGIRDSYLQRCETVGRKVRVTLPGGGELTGVAKDVDDAGRLVVVDEYGVHTKIAAGDVTHVRPKAD